LGGASFRARAWGTEKLSKRKGGTKKKSLIECAKERANSKLGEPKKKILRFQGYGKTKPQRREGEFLSFTSDRK